MNPTRMQTSLTHTCTTGSSVPPLLAVLEGVEVGLGEDGGEDEDEVDEDEEEGEGGIQRTVGHDQERGVAERDGDEQEGEDGEVGVVEALVRGGTLVEDDGIQEPRQPQPNAEVEHVRPERRGHRHVRQAPVRRPRRGDDVRKRRPDRADREADDAREHAQELRAALEHADHRVRQSDQPHHTRDARRPRSVARIARQGDRERELDREHEDVRGGLDRRAPVRRSLGLPRRRRRSLAPGPFRAFGPREVERASSVASCSVGVVPPARLGLDELQVAEIARVFLDDRVGPVDGV
mmetsp:Transcript_4041/g.16170  ORF Transcript_4041/g.16170 Transcript_4041/m.16170 type:complete len:293 (+) Transcript_4041:1715-2593(+)